MNDLEALIEYQNHLASLADFCTEPTLVLSSSDSHVNTAYKKHIFENSPYDPVLSKTNLPVETNYLPPTPLHLQPGQIWLLKPMIFMNQERLFKHLEQQFEAPAGAPCYALITDVDSTVLIGGERYRGLELCPLSPWLNLSQSDDLFLIPKDSHLLNETLLIETWNPVYSLRLSLDTYLGEIESDFLDVILRSVETHKNELNIFHSVSQDPFMQFQIQEQSLMNYLEEPLIHLNELYQQSQAYGAAIYGQHIKPKASTDSQTPQKRYFPALLALPTKKIKPAAAASDVSEIQEVSSIEPELTSYRLSEKIQLDLWIQETQICFRFYHTDIWGKPPGVEGIKLEYTSITGKEVTLGSNAEGIISLAIQELLSESENILTITWLSSVFYFPLKT